MTQFVVSAGRVNFRSAPIIADNILATLNRGQILEGGISTQDAEWLDVATIIPNLPGETRGFVSAQFVAPAQDAVSANPTSDAPNITTDQIRKLVPTAKMEFVAPLATNCVAARQELGLEVTPLHICHFMAQLAHESAGFRTMREFWGPTPAQQRYEGRKDLGNTQPGDGKRFMGRGYLQITGRANYTTYGAAISQPLTTSPELAEDPVAALNIACIYWKNRKIDIPAGQNNISEVTRRINGGFNGLSERTALFKKAMQIWN